MKTGTVLLVGGGGLALWYLIQLGSAVGTVQIVFQGVQLKSLTHYVVTLTVQNISNISVDVNSMTGNVFLNGNSLASISDFDKRTVPANGQVNIDCEVSPDIFGIPGAVKDLVNGGANILNFTATGNFNVNGIVLPFNLDKTINI
jgi:LEA14-like dessication related protein